MGKIGTVTAVALPSEFQFQVSPSAEKPLLQDFVVVEHPKKAEIPVLAKIVRISRFNPLLPEESALELAKLADESLAPLPIAGKMEMVACACQVLGSIDEFSRLRSPGFPVKPGLPVYVPSPGFMAEVLSGKDTLHDLYLGTLRNRTDIRTVVNANEILNKHLAVLAMTGSGKTYAASVLLEELMGKGYPLLIIDPHGDYVNIRTKSDEVNHFTFPFGGANIAYEIKVYENSIDLTELDQDDFIDFIASLSEEDVSSAQRGEYKKAHKYARDHHIPGLQGIFEYVNQERGENGNKTLSAMLRQLGAVRSIISDVESTLKMNEIESSLGRGKGVVLNMSALPAPVQRINVQIILGKLFERRKKFVATNEAEFRIPPIMIVVEEAHNFAPAVVEEELYPSRTILRRIATEGRKFGFGLCVISQRPSRLDATVLSQCNSQLILRIVNPNDQNYIRQTVESLASADLLTLPELSQGEALLSGSMIPIPSLVRIRLRESKEGIPAMDRLKEIAEYG